MTKQEMQEIIAEQEERIRELESDKEDSYEGSRTYRIHEKRIAYLEEREQNLEEELESLRKEYENYRIKTMPDITEEEIETTLLLPSIGHLDRPTLTRRLLIAEKKLQRREEKIKELQKELYHKKYDKYKGSDEMGYFQLKEQLEQANKDIKFWKDIAGQKDSSLDKLRKRVDRLENITMKDKVALHKNLIEERQKQKERVKRKVGRPPIPEEKEQIIIELYEQGKSQREIGYELAISPASVNRTIKKYRSMKEPGK